MGTATRNRSATLVAGAGLAVVVALMVATAIVASLLGQGGCGTGSSGAPSSTARRGIPADFLALYQQIGPRYGIPWQILAGIGREECDHGRNPDPSCAPHQGQAGAGVANFAGAAGPMQIGV